MSKEVDERVVEMRFDNEHFEKNVKTSMSTLDKFTEKLRFKNIGKGFEDVEKAAKNTDLSPLSKSAEKVGLKFDAMYTMADQALRNITNSAMNAGKRIVSALTIDPIKTGLSEYETQINSVQTILANTESKGSTLQDVNSALAELNAYADKTIYNFTEMTRNIGTFTAAGVELDTSVSAIKGIANLAAVSGSTSQQASVAMYQLSQALSSGSVKLMDWNSVVNAGMGGQVFQDSLKETARVHGIAIDDMLKKHGSFRETLSEGWITSEILLETLSKFTGDLSEEQLKQMGYTEEQIAGIMKLGKTANDAATKVKTFTQLFDTLKEAAQSGWTKSWELLIGDFGEAKGLLTDISDFMGGIIGDSADKRNSMLMGGLSTGWKQLLEEGIHDAGKFESTVSAIAKKHGVDLKSMVNDEVTFQDALRSTLKDGTLTSDVLSESISTFTEKIGAMSAKELEAAGYTSEQIKKLKELDEGVKNGTVSMEHFAELIVRPSGRELLIESLWNSIKALSSVITPVKEAFEEFFPALNGDQLYSAIKAIRDFTAMLTLNEEQSENLKRTFRGVFAVLDIGVQMLKAIAGGFVDLVRYIAPAGNGLLAFTGGIGDFLVGVNKAAKSSDIFTKIIAGIGKILKPVGDVVKSFAGVISEAFKSIADNSEERLEPLISLGSILKTVFGGLFTLFSKLASGVGGAVSSLFNTISESIQNADYTKIFDIINGGIFSAFGIFLAKFVKSTGDVVDSLGEIFEGLGETIESFSMSIKADALKKIATALLILAAALFVLSLIDSEKLTASIAAITVLFGELIGSLSLFTKISDGKKFNNIGKVTRAMLTLGSALLILSVAMKIMSTMSWKEMGVGLISTVVGLGSLIAAVNLLPESKVNKAASAVKKLSSSLVVLAVAMKIMGSMSWSEMGVGLITTAVGMGILVGAVNLLPQDAKSRTAGMIGLATSLVILGAALKIMSSMDIKEIGVALLGMVVGLGAIVAAVNLLPKDTAIKTLGLIGLATSLVILGAALNIMGSMGWDEIGRGLTVLAGSLTLIVIAMALMKTALPGAAALLVVAASLAILAPVLMGLGSMSWESIAKGLVAIAGAFTVIGVAALVLAPLVPVILGLSAAIALLGVGCLAVGVGIGALAAALAVGGAAIVVFISSLISLIPFIIEQIGIGIIALCEVIAGGADSICKAFSTIVLALVDALVSSVPALVEGIFVLIESVLTSLVEHTPAIVGALFDFLIAIINATAEKLPDLIQAGVNLLMSFLTGVIDALKNIDPNILVEGILAVGFMTTLMVALAAMALLAPAAMVGVLAFGAVIAELAIVLAAIGALSKIPGLEDFVEDGGDFLQKIGTAIGQFIGGLVGGFASAATDALPEIATNLSEFIKNLTPFIEGVNNIDGNIVDYVDTLIDFIKGIKKFCNKAEGIKSDNLSNAVSTIRELVTLCASLNAKNTTNISNFGKALETTAKDGINKFVETFKSDTSVNNAKTAINNFVSKVSKAVKTDENKQKFVSIGKYLMDGLKLGITNNESKVISAAVSVATAVYNAAKEALMINSPSKKFVELGAGADEGLAKGIDENADIAENAARDLATDIVDTTKDELEINSPSLVMNKVGKYICQGIAEGILSDTSPEDAMKIKLANIFGAYEEYRASLPEGATAVSFGQVLLDNGIRITRTDESNAKKAGKDVYTYMYDLSGEYYAAGYSGIDKAANDAADEVKNKYSKAIGTIEDELKKSEINYELDSLFTTDSSKKTQLKKDYLSEQIAGKTKLIGEYEKQIADYKAQTNGVEDSFVLGLQDDIVKLKKEISEHQEALTAVPETVSSETADKISKTYKKTTDRIKAALEMAKLKYENWVASYPDAKQSVKHNRLFDYLNEELNLLKQQEENSRQKLNEIAKISSHDSEEYKSAYEEWVRARVDRLAKEEEISDTQEQHLKELDAADDRVRETEYELWQVKHRDASTQVALARQLQYLNESLKDTEEDSAKFYEEYLKVVEREGDMSSEAVKTALANWNESVKKEVELRNSIKDNWEASLAAEEESSDRLRESAYDLWKSENANASDREKLTKELSYIEERIVDAHEDVLKAQKEYDEALVSEDATQTEINNKLADLNEAKKVEADLQQEKNDTNDSIRALVEEERNIASDVAKLKYDIWEKTEGRDSKDEVKEAKQLEYLNEQLLIQNQLIGEAYGDYVKAMNEHGSDSIEATRSYKAYLDEAYNLASLKNEILDLEESAADRQKRLKDKQDLAQTEYEDYIKKYEKYYLANGMSRADLEKDAKLVTGYDPNKIVNNITSKTKTALETVTTSVGYQSILTGFTDMGTSYVKAVNEGITAQSATMQIAVTNIAAECAKKLISSRPDWVNAGDQLVNGLIQGVKNGRSKAIQAAYNVALSMIMAARLALDINSPSKKFAEIGKYSVLGLVKGLVDNSGLADDAAYNVGERAIESLKSSIRKIADVVNADLDTQPTIRPVLDLSNVRSGTARLNAMVSNAQAIAISDSRKAREYSDTVQNGNDASANTGNTYQFTQNNYSPKALSRPEIYRQTKNQFAAMKEVLA